MTDKLVYFFGGGNADGRGDMKSLLGGKGANLAEMTALGLPVPPGFTITTDVCTYYMKHQTYPDRLEDSVKEALKRVEELMGSTFGSPDNPLLVSVRSGARASMPGMMDTILNLGLNEETVKGLANKTGDNRFAWDCYRRFIQMFGEVVMAIKPRHEGELNPFDHTMEVLKQRRGVSQDVDLTTEDLQELTELFRKIILERTGKEFPQDPWVQLWEAIGAVFKSWLNERAIAYRRLNNIPDTWGTAVNVQAMVFGNMGPKSATGVAFTRNPATGEKEFYGEYLVNAQGEDVVAGIRTPKPISRMVEEMPQVYQQLERIRTILEQHFRDVQDFEFTVQEGKLWMLQTRAGKRTGLAAIRIAVEMVKEGLITTEEALLRVEPDQLNQLLRPIFHHQEKEQALKDGRLLTRGLNAGPGAASGQIAFSANRAMEMASRGIEPVLVRIETSPEDIKGMNAAVAILTSRGGMTSHAALVARQMGKVCVVGCEALNIDYKSASMRVNGKVLREGDIISLDGTTGEVIEGPITTLPSEVIQVLVNGSLPKEKSYIYQLFSQLLSWADDVRRLRVRANADQPDQARIAKAFGAEGIGLCRTEHMFFGGERITAMREMILAETKEERQRALAKLLPIQREDFLEIFRVMDGLPVTIRTLDPPLHEFLPQEGEAIERVAHQMGVSVDQIKAKVDALHEANPMLGHRGCRLGIVFPEITEMQAQAIFEAAAIAIKEGKRVYPEIMIPLVGFRRELAVQTEIIHSVARKVMEAQQVKIDYLVGTMIELPRAAIVADEIAEVAEFFSFGTNDLTQTTLGISRDDAKGFLPYYIEHRILDSEPFQTLDIPGVGKLIEWGVERGRNTRPNLKIGICGEHGGDPRTIEFCHNVGLDYVSCSPFRIPIARLAAAQAVLKRK